MPGDVLDLLALATLVKRCRDAQRRFFRSGARDDLETSKSLERQVDRALSEILESPTPLFDRPSE